MIKEEGCSFGEDDFAPFKIQFGKRIWNFAISVGEFEFE